MTNCKVKANYFLEENELMNIIDSIKKRDIDYESGVIYILPEYIDDEKDVLNGLTPNINKILLLDNENCRIVYNKDNFTYLTLNDVDIVFPLLFDISIGLVANIIVYYIDKIIKKNRNESNIKVKFISKENKKEKYKQYEIEGNVESVIETLKILEKEDE